MTILKRGHPKKDNSEKATYGKWQLWKGQIWNNDKSEKETTENDKSDKSDKWQISKGKSEKGHLWESTETYNSEIKL